MKTFGGFLLTLLVVVIIVGIVGVISYNHEMAPTWNEIARQQAQLDMAIARQNAQADIAQHATVSMAISAGSWVLVLLILAGGVVWFVWKPMHERQESERRMVDGQFPLQVVEHNGRRVYMDPNKSQFGFLAYDQATGEIVTDAGVTGPDRQLTYANNVQRTRTVAAKPVDGRKPSRNELLDQAGFFENKARVEDARAQLAERRLLAAEPGPVADEPAGLLPSWNPISLADAFSRSTPDEWYLGQNAHGPCKLSIQTTHHIGVLGAQGTGKTAGTATLLMLYALKNLSHVIALDGKGGVDWMRYKSHIEVYPTDDSMIGDQVDAIYQIYQKRLKELGRAGASDIYELDYQMKPIVVFLEEFGSTMDTLKAENGKAHAATELQIKEIFRKGRSTGIHLVLIDQLMRGWPGVMKANAKGIIAYKILGQQGNAFNAYELHKLADRGQFWHNDQVYDAWNTKAEAPKLLQKLQPSKIKLLTDVQYSVVDDTDSTSTARGGVSSIKIHPPFHNTSTDTDEAKNTVFSPVDDTSIDTGTDTSTVQKSTSAGTDTGTDTGTLKPRMEGKPVSPKDKNLVVAEYKLQGSINKTCEALYGGLSPSRKQWIKDILIERGVIEE